MSSPFTIEALMEPQESQLINSCKAIARWKKSTTKNRSTHAPSGH
jgi:hypothetical protein